MLNPAPMPAEEASERAFARDRSTRDIAGACGGIELILGCMFSGKTTRMLRRLLGAEPGRYATFKHQRDTRYVQRMIVTHSGLSIEAEVVRMSGEIGDRLPDGVALVGIDEAHFFDDGLPEACEALRGRGVEVMLTGLDRTSWGRPFPIIERLRGSADCVRMMTAVCARCGGSGEYTQRLTPIVGGDIIGGPDAFEPRCAACWRPPPEPPVD